MKVIIADDEKRICQLIQNLVCWEDFGMEVIACVHDGIEALETIQKRKPELVITDIRMPGYDGLELIRRAKISSPETEFVIISGYRHFEYAQNALQYGVKNYLLKPVKKAELADELRSIQKINVQRARKNEADAKKTIIIQNNKDRLRETFMQNALINMNFLKTKMLDDINEQYQFSFREDLYQIVIFKIDGMGTQPSSATEFIQEKVVRLAQKMLQSFCYELEHIWIEHFCYFLLNYGESGKKEVRRILKSLIGEMLWQKEIFKSFYVTIGLGSIQKEILHITQSAQQAKRAIEQRVLDGTNRVIEPPDMYSNKREKYISCPKEFKQSLAKAIDCMDEEIAKCSIQLLCKDLQTENRYSGADILEILRDALRFFIFTLQQNGQMVSEANHLFLEFEREIDDLYSIDMLMQCLEKKIVQTILSCINKRQSEGERPIREAKRYVREHYDENISLDILSNEVGMNASYLSTLFKKQTGNTFSEYLTQVRMEKAKEFLKESEENISNICERVGYNDLKSFTKNFKSYTGMRPNEYRKIFG